MTRKKEVNYETMLENRNVLIADLQNKNYGLTKENITLYKENKDLRFENEEQLDLIKRLDKIIYSNKYNNEKATINKIKELISDYQSQN